jgi:PAS domain-containing protein
LLKDTETLDYKTIFDLMPGMCLILDTSFNIIAQNSEHARATLSTSVDIVGRPLFEMFPDNPDHAGATGVASVRESLVKVLKTRKVDAMPIVRYDVQAEDGTFEARYWAITNTPILGEDGYVRWIVNHAQDVTAFAKLRL